MSNKPDVASTSVAPIRIIHAVIVSVVIGVSLGTVILLGLRALRTPPVSTLTPVTLGTADHWRRIDSIANVVDVQTFSDNSTWALFAGGAIGRLDGDQWALMPDQVMGDSIVELPGGKPSLLVIGSTRTAWRTDDRGANWQEVDLGDAFATSNTSLWAGTGASGDLWIASETALTHYVQGRWSSAPIPAGVTLMPTRGMLVARDGSVWVTISKSGVPSALAHYRADGGWDTWETVRPRGEVRFMEDAKGGLWFAAVDGTAYCDGKTTVTYSLAAMHNQPEAARFAATLDTGAIDGQRNVWWAASNGEIFRFDGHTWRFYAPGDADLPLARPDSTLVADKEGAIWLGGDGLARFKDGRWERFDPANGEPFNDKMPKLYITYGRPLARDGSLWFAVSAAGVVRFDGKAWTWFGPQNNALRMAVTAKVHDSYLPLASTYDGGVLLYQTFEHAVYRYVP